MDPELVRVVVVALVLLVLPRALWRFLRWVQAGRRLVRVVRHG